MTSRLMAHSGHARRLTLPGGDHSVGHGASWLRAVVVRVNAVELPAVELGVKIAVVAGGNPVALNVKLSLKPVAREIVRV